MRDIMEGISFDSPESDEPPYEMHPSVPPDAR